VAINKGYQHAWATIVDSNITSLIAGIALVIWLWPGARLCRGALYRHFDLDVLIGGVFPRLVNLWYGRRRNLKSHVYRLMCGVQTAEKPQ
jgi:preprotein translocase subunit SecD